MENGKGNSENGKGFLSRVGSVMNMQRQGRGQRETQDIARVGSKLRIAGNRSGSRGLSTEELAG